ncbi:MAG: bis-aminopropyl spermidine synthase family protein [Candidatus Aenigmatarchaeota archaeon]
MVKEVDFTTLERLYDEFLDFYLVEYKRITPKRFGIDKIKNLSTKLIEDVYWNYERKSFFNFSLILRDFWFYSDPFIVMKKFNLDIEPILVFLKFLKRSKIARIGSNKVKFNIDFSSIFIKPSNKDEIIRIIEKRFGGINLNKSVLENIGYRYSWKENFDQIPITLRSAILVSSEITKYFPFNTSFLFIGADDFIYFILKSINPKMEISVLDIDKNLITLIEEISKHLGLSFEFLNMDIRDGVLKKKFLGTFCNPPYTLDGIVSFLSFSSSAISKKGGVNFLIFGDECIGNRMLFLQSFFSRKNLIIRKIISRKISYIFQNIYKEDRLMEKISRAVGLELRNREYISASLYVLEKIPFKVKKIKINGEIYSYL